MLAVVVAGGLSSGAAHAEVVFGNLGPAGTGTLTNTNVDSNTLPLAQGFTVNNPPASHQLASVTLGLYNLLGGNPTATTVSLWSAIAGLPDSSLHTSSAVPVGGKGLYTFLFSSVSLTPGGTYFVVPNDGASWYYAGDGLTTTVATAQNGSGYSDAGIAVNPGGFGWQPAGAGNFSLSVDVSPAGVPEIDPAGMGSALALVSGALGLLERRRRQTA